MSASRVVWVAFLLCISNGGTIAQELPMGWLPSRFLQTDPSLRLISDPHVQADLGISKKQVDEISQLMPSVLDKHEKIEQMKSDGLKRMRNENVFKVRSELIAEAREINSEIRKNIFLVLGAKKTRFMEILFQYHLHRGSYELAFDVYGKSIENETAFNSLRKRLEQDLRKKTSVLQLEVNKRLASSVLGAESVDSALSNMFFDLSSDKDTPEPVKKNVHGKDVRGKDAP